MRVGQKLCERCGGDGVIPLYDKGTAQDRLIARLEAENRSLRDRIARAKSHVKEAGAAGWQGPDKALLALLDAEEG